jgi:transcriptional regulator with XRE-family HTH domain
MARRASGWSQRQLADAMTRLGYPWQQQTVAKVERGDRPLRLSEAMVMASVLGVPVDVLCSDRDDRSTAALSAPSALDLAQQLVRVLRDEGE